MKSTLLSCFAILCSYTISAQVDGPLNGNQFSTTTISGYTQSWINTAFVSNSDDNYSSFGDLNGPAGSYSDYLIATDFGFDLPDGVSIFGIKVEVERSDPNLLTSDYSIRIIKGGLVGNGERSSGIAYPATDAYQVYGSETDLWDESWSYKDIDNSNFGVAIAAQRNANGGITAGRVDNIMITVYYGFLTLPVTLLSFDAIKQDKLVKLTWTTASEQQMLNYAVERSADGRTFHPLKNVEPYNIASASYSYKDEDPLPGISYYRIKSEDVNGKVKFTNTLSVHFSLNNIKTLSPSPWTTGKELFINNPDKEQLSIGFYNTEGRLIGVATTNSHLVPTPLLSNIKGVLYYRITGDMNKLKGTGSILVY